MPRIFPRLSDSIPIEAESRIAAPANRSWASANGGKPVSATLPATMLLAQKDVVAIGSIILGTRHISMCPKELSTFVTTDQNLYQSVRDEFM